MQSYGKPYVQYFQCFDYFQFLDIYDMKYKTHKNLQ